MSFSLASLRLLRQHLRVFEHTAQRASRSIIHTKVRPRCSPLSRPIAGPSTSPLSRRSFTTYSTPTEKLRAAIRDARQRHPILLPVLSIATFGSVCLLGLLAYDQYTRPDPNFAGWPAPVENQLRMALHFTHKRPNPDQAASFFGGALQAAERCGMDPFSKEVMGIRIRLAEMLEQFGRAKAAIDVLGGIVKDCQERLTELSRGAVQEALKSDTTFVREEQIHGSQAALLRGIIEAKVKMAQLYHGDYIQDPTSAKKTMEDAISLLLQNTEDPKKYAFNENNASGLSLDEVAAMLYDMAQLYSATNEPENAVQTLILTRNALRKACNGQPSCREVEVMTSICSVLRGLATKPDFTWNGKPSTPETAMELRRAAIGWNGGAYDTYMRVPDDDRDETCSRALFSASISRASLMEQVGECQESKVLWTALLKKAKERGNDLEMVAHCQVGINIAENCLRRQNLANTSTNKRE